MRWRHALQLCTLFYLSCPCFICSGLPIHNCSDNNSAYNRHHTRSISGNLIDISGRDISLSLNPSVFSPMSVAAGVVGAVCAGMLYTNRRTLCALTYLVLLLIFGLYPSVGPLWIFPQVMWFHVVMLLILISPLQSAASSSFKSAKATRLFFAFFVTSLTSTLAGQIAGNIVFETIPITDPRGTWLGLTFVYPFERTIIALIAAFIGVPLFEALKTTHLTNVTQRLKK